MMTCRCNKATNNVEVPFIFLIYLIYFDLEIILSVPSGFYIYFKKPI